jgi:transposase-like protein
MGYAFVMGHCLRCQRLFSFNPHKVPSIRIKGEKEPICKDCHSIINEKRKEAGVPLWPDPLPGAYEAFPEEEL